MKLFIDIVVKRIYLFNIVAWNYRKKIGFPVCKKENFAGLQAHRKRGKSARASHTPHHTLNEERSARFTAQHLSALSRILYFALRRSNKTNWFPEGPDIKCFVIFLDLFFNSNKRITGVSQNSRLGTYNNTNLILKTTERMIYKVLFLYYLHLFPPLAAVSLLG